MQSKLIMAKEPKNPLEILEAVTEKDLSFYYNESPSDLGERSNFNGIAQSMLYGGAALNQWHDSFSERTILAVSKKREIEKILATISPKMQKVLAASFCYRKPADPSIVDLFKEKSWLAICLSTVEPIRLASMCRRHTMERKGLNSMEKLFISDLKTSTDEAYENAVRSYVDARNQYMRGIC